MGSHYGCSHPARTGESERVKKKTFFVVSQGEICILHFLLGIPSYPRPWQDYQMSRVPVAPSRKVFYLTGSSGNTNKTDQVNFSHVSSGINKVQWILTKLSSKCVKLQHDWILLYWPKTMVVVEGGTLHNPYMLQTLSFYNSSYFQLNLMILDLEPCSHTWVVLPDPVSPKTRTTRLSFMICTISSWRSYTGSERRKWSSSDCPLRGGTWGMPLFNRPLVLFLSRPLSAVCKKIRQMSVEITSM